MKFLELSFEKSVGAVLFREEDGERKYLLLKYRSGQWDFPKGHVEEGESEKETLFREIEEETGIKEMEIIEGFKSANNFYYSAKGNERMERIGSGKGIYIFKRAVFYLARTKPGNLILNHENSEYAWIVFGKALEMLGNKGSKKTLRRAENFLAK